jgi:ActR/RegA family two-component response regulator
MALSEMDAFLPPPATQPSRRVVLVDADERASSLLARYLEARGWTVQRVSDARRAVRQWGTAFDAPLVLLRIEDDDPDAFELLGALAARAVAARVVVAGDLSPDDARSLGVDHLLPARPRFSAVASALERLDGHAFAIREVS